LLEVQLAATLPTGANLVEQAGLAATVRIEVYETVSKQIAGSPGVVEAHVVHRLSIADAILIGEIVTALDADLVLGPRARVPTPFVLEFHGSDGVVQSVGYAVAGENPGILRGEQGLFRRQDAKPPVEFEELMRELLAASGAGS
jgi:flavin reductase (DIM6/NTAB) family NADH-FMN oxidoreductase RutF